MTTHTIRHAGGVACDCHPQAVRTPMQTATRIRDRIASLTVDDAVIASAILAEISAGHEEMADRLMVISGLGDLDVPDLEYLCRRYDVAFDDDLEN